MCSKFNHKQCCRTCACAVACLCPHNSISIVVASLSIHDVTYEYIYTLFYDMCESMCICICICERICMCICMSVFRDLESGLR